MATGSNLFTISSALTALSLSACATPYTEAQLASMARGDSTPNLCAVTLMAPPISVLNAAENELRARGATCDWQQAKAIAETQTEIAERRREAQQQQFQNSMQMLGVAGALLQQSGPRYYAPPPTQTTCIQQGVFKNCTSQ